jgi:poly(hydroxyalkanoate) granule-associated protein
MSKTEDIKKNSHKMIEESGHDDFENLVERGQRFERDMNSSRGPNSESRLDDLKSKANQTMDRIERAFDLRVSSALGRLGISRKSDLELLNEKIDRLAEMLEKVATLRTPEK